MTIYADGTDYTVEAEQSQIGTGSVTYNFTLVDEDENILVDEDGNILISEEPTAVYGEALYADGTDYTVHAEE